MKMLISRWKRRHRIDLPQSHLFFSTEVKSTWKEKKELNKITHAAMETGTFKVKSCKKNTALKPNVLKDRFFQHELSNKIDFHFPVFALFSFPLCCSRRSENYFPHTIFTPLAIYASICSITHIQIILTMKSVFSPGRLIFLRLFNR